MLDTRILSYIIMVESTLPVFQDFAGAEVWKHFLRSECGKFAQCKVCKKRIEVQSTPLNRATSVRGHFDPIKRRTLLPENILY